MTRENDIHANDNNTEESSVVRKLVVETLKSLDAAIKEENGCFEYYKLRAREYSSKVEGLQKAKSVILKKFNITERISSEYEDGVVEYGKE